MRLYICLECGCIFHTPKQYTEKHGLDSPPYERFTGCPKCGAAFAPAIFCDCCGDVVLGKYARINDGRVYCDGCYSIKDIDEVVI